MSEFHPSKSTQPPRRRLWIGGGIFVLGQIAPFLIPLLVQLDLSPRVKTVASGLLLLGIPELAILLTVAVLGKSGYAYLRERILRLIKRQVISPDVSRSRHRVGLVIFLLPIVWAWGSPYVLEVFPGVNEYGLTLAITGDALLLMGLVLLGGQFWESLRQLFVYRRGSPA